MMSWLEKNQLKEELFAKITMTNLRESVDAINNVAKDRWINLIYHKEKKLIGYVGKSKLME